MNLQRAQHGLTSVEYAVMGGVVILALVAALAGFSPVLSKAFNAIVAWF